MAKGKWFFMLEFLKNKIQTIEIIAIIALYAFLFYSIASTSFADDLGFDFAGYAVRYNNAFAGWFPYNNLGLPASTFDGFVPSLLPLFFKMMGFGAFTLPLILSILLLKALIPVAFIPLGKIFRQRKTTSVLIGLLFVLNPIIFKFLNRYYELAGWLFFIIFFTYFYLLLKSEKFEKKHFVPCCVFASLAVLSHPTSAFFAALTAILFFKKGSFKKIAMVGIFSILLSAMWLVPFAFYYGLGAVSETAGFLLETQGIFLGTIFLAAILIMLAAVLFSKREENSIEFDFISRLSAFAVLQFLLKDLPLIKMPFAHSYHVFYLIAIVLMSFVFLEKRIFSAKLSAKILIALFVVCAVLGLVLFAKISGQYFFSEPRFSDYELGGEKIDFEKIDSLLKTIPTNERFEVLPRDVVVNAYAAQKYRLSSVDGWGYNAFALKNSVAKTAALNSMETGCGKFNELNKSYGISKWLALKKNAFDYLQKCGWKTESQNAPALFHYPEKISILENGELLEFESNYVKFKAVPPKTLVKMNYFPRWNAYAGVEKIAVESENDFIAVKTGKEAIVELRYEKSFADYIGYFISGIAIIFGIWLLLAKNPEKRISSFIE